MKTNRTNSLLRWLPSLTDVAFLMPLVFLFTRMQGVRTLLDDCDTGWHVRAGEWMLQHHAVIRTDPFSFTKAGQPWFAWEWLWEVCFAWLYRKDGLSLVVLVSVLVICATFALLYRVLMRRCGNPLIAAAVALLAAAGSTIHWLARPHLFTLLFTVIFLAILDRVREGRERLLLWLPVLMVVWTNMHGGFLAGILILAAYTGGELLRAATAASAVDRKLALRGAIPYGLTALVCAAATMVNPYSYHLHQHLWQYFTDPNQTRNINEFQSVNFQYPVATFLESMLVLAGGAAIWLGARRRLGEVLLLAGWAHLGVLMARNVPIFMIVAAPAVAEAATAWLAMLRELPIASWIRGLAEAIRSTGEEMLPMERIGRVHALPMLAMVALALGMRSPQAGLFLRPEFDEASYPARALPLLTDPSERIFTHDEWGDYLIYRLSPEGGKVYVDGRSDFYGGKFASEYMDVLHVKYDWEQILARYGVNTILMPPDAPLASTLKESQHWRSIYDDGTAIVFRAAAPSAIVSQASTTSQGGETSVYRSGARSAAPVLAQRNF